MPHIHLDHFPMKQSSDMTEDDFLNEMATLVVKYFGCSYDAVSISLSPVAPERWNDEVYGPKIMGKSECLKKKPNY